MKHKKSYQIFKAGSTTYYFSSLFFPKNIRNDIADFYAFVRYADNLVDSVPQKKEEFRKFDIQLRKALIEKRSNNSIIENLLSVMEKYDIDNELIISFIEAMEKDLNIKSYQSIEELLDYIHGSAEVIGVIMAKIFHLNKQSYKYAKLLGRAMQYANFIRDVSEDIKLGRQYLPSNELYKYDIKSLAKKEVVKNINKFTNFINAQIEFFFQWQEEAEKGFKFIPFRYRVAVRTASNMYIWTMETIKKDPLLIYEKKVKPTRLRIFVDGVKNMFVA